MNKRKNIFLLYFLLIIELLVLINSKLVIKNVISSCNMFISKIFPSLFPTMVIGLLLVKSNIEIIIPKSIKKLFKKFFNFNDAMINLYIISMLTGTPSNAIYINEYLNNNFIDEKQVEILLCSTHFINPLFVIGGVGIGVFNSFKIGVLLLILLWCNNLLKLFLLRNKNEIFEEKSLEIRSVNPIKTLSYSIKNSVNALLMILGIVIMFNILVTLICNIFNISELIVTLINGTLEMTGGIIKLSYLKVNTTLKFLISYLFLNFGGLCIQLQALSMIDNKKIKYYKYFIYRMF